MEGCSINLISVFSWLFRHFFPGMLEPSPNRTVWSDLRSICICSLSGLIFFNFRWGCFGAVQDWELFSVRGFLVPSGSRINTTWIVINNINRLRVNKFHPPYWNVVLHYHCRTAQSIFNCLKSQKSFKVQKSQAP